MHNHPETKLKDPNADNQDTSELNKVQTEIPTEEPKYESFGGRRNSIFTTNGHRYTAGIKIGSGFIGIVRQLDTEQKQLPRLVVKSFKKSFDSNDEPSEITFLKTAYPNLAKHIHFFCLENYAVRMVMPHLGNLTLSELLMQHGISLNQRLMHLINAVNELDRIHNVAATSHGDAHTDNALFDDKMQCHFIDGNFKKSTAKTCAADFEKLIYNALSCLSYQAQWLSPGRKSGEENVFPGNLYIDQAYDKSHFTYYVFDLRGKLVKGKVTNEEIKQELEAEPSRFEKFLAVFNDHSISEAIEENLDVFLSITSKRGHTAPPDSCYLSPNFRNSLKQAKTAEKLIDVLKAEMRLNNQKLIAIQVTISEQLKQGLAAAKVVKPTNANIFKYIESQIPEVDEKQDEDKVDFTAIDNITLQLMHVLYQVERSTSHKNWHFRFLGNNESEAYLAAKPFLTVARELLRTNLPLLPEIPVPTKQILNALQPEHCETYKSLVTKILKT